MIASKLTSTISWIELVKNWKFYRQIDRDRNYDRGVKQDL